MNSKALVLNVMRAQGKSDALSLRSRAAELDGTAILAEEEKIPAFDSTKDYSQWPSGAPVTDEDQVWTLLQPHNAAAYTGRPSSLRSLWGLTHTKDPAKAKPWVAPLGTSGLYMTDECCVCENRLWRSKQDSNSYMPGEVGTEEMWEDMGEI